jgi:hypothetical protein
MSLSGRQRQVLDSIEEGLAQSDPDLVRLLATFTRLASGEKMPVRENIATSSLRRPLTPRCRSGRSRPRRRYMLQQPGLYQAAALMCVLMIAALVVGVTVFSRGSHGECQRSWVVPCASSPAAPGSHPAAHGRPASRTREPAGPHPAPG